MNIFGKLILIISILASNCIFAQQDNDNFTKTSINSDYSFNGDWKITRSSESIFVVTGNKITNNSKRTSKTLFLNLYFVPNDSNLSLNLENLNNKVGKDITLGKLEGKGSSFNNIYLSFNDQDTKKLKNGSYSLIVLLKAKETNKIINYKVLDDRISLINNKVSIKEVVNMDKIGIHNESKEIVPTPIPTTKPIPTINNSEEELFDSYVVTESSIVNENTNSKLSFQGIWELSIDFETFLINVSGQGNRIVNSNTKPTNDLKLLVYFSKDNLKDSKEINGYELTSIDLPPISGLSIIQNPTYKTNITKLLPKGEYYPILIILEKNSNNNYVLRSTVSLGKKYIWP